MNDIWVVGIGTIVATFTGPIAAVLVTRYVDHRRERYRRRLDVFRILMRSRRFPVSADFVGGLNLIDVEFYDCPGVIQAWRAYLDNLNGPAPVGEQDNQRVAETRNQLWTNIMSEMTKVLRLPIPGLDIFRGGYSPQGWVETETDASLSRRFLADVAVGRRSTPVEMRMPPA